MNLFQSIKNGFNHCVQVVKKYPGPTVGILTTLGAAGGFAGGMLVAPSAIIHGFVIGGACVAAGLTCACCTALGSCMESNDESWNHEAERPFANPNEGICKIFTFVGVAAGIGVGIGVASSSLAGMIFCGTGIAAGVGTLCGVTAWGIKTCRLRSSVLSSSSTTIQNNADSSPSQRLMNGSTSTLVTAGIVNSATAASVSVANPTTSTAATLTDVIIVPASTADTPASQPTNTMQYHSLSS